MDIQKAYNFWAEQYDNNDNKTRDLEGIALREILANISINNCLEIGCGTGKNTVWLLEKATHLTAVDLSEEMLAKATKKISSNKVEFVQADSTLPWDFTQNRRYDLVVFSLVLEHIQDLKPIFEKVAMTTTSNAYIYIGELHPFKQYAGSKARFIKDDMEHVVTCFTHHISEFIQLAQQQGFEAKIIKEYFDNNDQTTIPRILALLLQKNG